MATPPVVKNLRDGELKLFDGDSPENSQLLALDEGNLQFTVASNVEQILDRGTLSHMRPGDEAAVEGSFAVKFTEFLNQGSNPTTPWEAFKQVGNAASWVSTNDDEGGVYTIGLRFTVRSTSTDEEDERITFAKVVATSIQFQEGNPNTLTVNFIDFETAPTIEKVAEGS